MNKNNEQLKKARIVHNPVAGKGAISKRKLINLIEAEGYKCSYSSTKKIRWENIEAEQNDFIVLAGGDGTVRKLAGELLQRKVLDKRPPIGLLPMGTANNIAKTLGLSGPTKKIIQGWRTGRSQKFDVGRIKGLEKPAFFLESFGYGLFPLLMRDMEKKKKNNRVSPEKRLQAALKLLETLILSSKVKKCNLTIDGKDYSGEFLLLEVMNIRSFGPNLHLAPDANPDDGQFDIVFIAESQRAALANYVRKKREGKEIDFGFPVLKGKDLEIFWNGKHIHVDDEYHKVQQPSPITIKLREGLLDFLVPAVSE